MTITEAKTKLEAMGYMRGVLIVVACDSYSSGTLCKFSFTRAGQPTDWRVVYFDHRGHARYDILCQ